MRQADVPSSSIRPVRIHLRQPLEHQVETVGMGAGERLFERFQRGMRIGRIARLTAGGERRRNTFALTSINPGPGQPNSNSNYHP